MSENLLNNNALASLARHAAPQVVRAIKDASTRTGVNFAYLMEQAAAESSFNAKAEAKTSSAAGLYQFIESTWLGMVKKHGAKHGMADLAAKIGAQGKVSDPAVKQQILDLRKDPAKAALLAAEFAADNQNYLERHVGGEIGSTELYFAHFMGAGGAAGFLNALKENPLQTAADLFPKEARANRNVFYDRKSGEARTLAGVYDFFAKKFGASSQQEMKNTVPAPPRVAPTVKNKLHDSSLQAYQALYAPAVADNIFASALGNAAPEDFLWLTRKENSGQNKSWQHVLPGGDSNALLFNPAELMLLASRALPTDDNQKQGKITSKSGQFRNFY